MKDYSAWKEKSVAVTSLQLDPSNPRLPPSAKVRTQRELIHELVHSENVVQLAKEIAEQGFWPVDKLIVFEDGDGKTYALEGNRRLTALKLLLNPDLAPGTLQRRFKNFQANIDTDKLKRVPVLLAPTREAANSILLRKHTLPNTQPWGVLMQARFYRRLVRDGMSVEDLSREYGVSASEVSSSLRLDAMYAIACSVQLPDDIRAIVQNSRLFNASLLERIIDTPKARELLRIEFDALGAPIVAMEKIAFERAYAGIISAIATKEVDTRELNSATQIVDFVRNCVPVASTSSPEPSSPHVFSIDEPTEASSPPDPTPAKPTPKQPSPKKPPSSATLVPKSVTCTASNARIKEVFAELKRIRVDDFPNATGLLLRALLDLSLGHYMEKSGKIEPIVRKANEKSDKGEKWFPTLNQMLTAVNIDRSIPLSPQARKKLDRMVSGKDSSYTPDLLDAMAHNRFELVKSRDLRGLWDVFEGLLQLTLHDPTPAEEPTRPPTPKPRTK
ncbi:MAG: hypothetical protein R3B70_18780 [Polyangiaceae bacterium]